MALYLAKMLCLEVRFQSTLASKLLRFSFCVADLEKLSVLSPVNVAGTKAMIFWLIASMRAEGIMLGQPSALVQAELKLALAGFDEAMNWLLPVPVAVPVVG